ncbi:MAG TPA: amino acid adenylation domain-containing protein, partial [Chloroflexota bacterium]
TLKSGAAFLALSIDDPPARLERVLEQARPRIVLTQRRLEHRLSDLHVETAALDGRPPTWNSASSIDPEHSASDASLSYLITTSGSTGEPKLVMNTHGGIRNRIQWVQRAYPLLAQDRMLQKTPATFDVSVAELLWPLVAGACLVISAPDGHKDPAYLAEIIDRSQVKVLHFVPSMLQVFLEHPGAAERCRSVRLVWTSGEALTSSQRDGCLRVFEAPVLNLYGPAEAAVDVSHWLCDTEAADDPVPIGRPIGDIRLYVLDRAGRLCGAEAPGELHIAGAGLGRGYARRPDLTAERFIPDPFSKTPGERMYRTGDLARWRADGVIEYLGRLDFQLKLRGQRVELGEIEESLRSHPEVHDAVVTAVTDPEGDLRLAAYVVGEGVDAVGLREHLAARLPAYMIPATFLALDALPMTPSGKADRKALPAPVWGAAARARQRVPPHDLLEYQLGQLWSDLLGVEAIGIRDHFFFDLGGHSLQALRLLHQVTQRFATAVPLSAFLQEPTIEATAKLLRRTHAPAAGEGLLVPLQPSGDLPPLFLVAPALGTAMVFSELGRVLSPHQPLYALQVPGLNGQAELVNGIAQLAERCVAAIQSVQQQGPYRLGGYSYGGVVAFEMACRLQADGDRAEALVIIDTLAPSVDISAPLEIDEPLLLVQIARLLAHYNGTSIPLGVDDVRGRSPAEGIELARRLLLEQGIASGPEDALSLERLLAVQRAALESLSSYSPGVYTSPLDLIRCSAPTVEDLGDLSPARFQERSFGWQQWCTQPVRVHWVSSDHLSLLRSPVVLETAQVMQQAMASVF